jgi:hypothetical protein
MPIIKKPNQHFGVLTYTGNGSASVTRSDTNAVNFTPDFVWIKSRSGTNYNNLYDVNRIVDGDHKRLYSNDTAAEESSTFSGDTNLNGFVNGGFTTGAGGDTNTNAATFVAWQWKAGGASTVNTSGTISSNVSVNTTAGFSVVTYTGTGANATVGHGLGVAPKMVIVKNRGAAVAWAAWHTSIANTQYLVLNTTAAVATGATWWNSTTPTSSVISVGTSTSTNASGNTYVAYCWAEVEGYSKFGSYTGNFSANGPFVYTGFRPKFILGRDTSVSEQEWFLYDTARNTINVADKFLSPTFSQAESSFNGAGGIDFLSNGFKIRAADNRENRSGSTYIYMAFAENPFKFSNAR